MIMTEIIAERAKNFSPLLSALIIAATALIAGAAGNAVLEADSMNYDPKSKSIVASGSVHFTSQEGELFGDRGVGYTDGRTFEMQGNVRGRFAEQSIDITCDNIELVSERSPDRRIMTANGRVRLSRGEDRFSADSVMWELGRENYRASGSVLMEFGSSFVDSDEASRAGESFEARNVRRYEDRSRRVTISARRATGLIANEEIVELTAEGGIVMNVAGIGGGNTRITGDKGVFSLDRGTIVVSGGAHATQEGRRLQAASIVYHLDGGRVEALGDRPTISFEMRD
jgi:lipopolysaccharide export system protein LptA